MMRAALIPLLMVLVALLPGQERERPPELRAEVVSISGILRPHAPLVLDITFDHRYARGLIEGELVATLREGAYELATHRSPLPPLGPGRRLHRLVLPATAVEDLADGATVDLSVVSDERTWPLGTHHAADVDRVVLMGGVLTAVVVDEFGGGGAGRRLAYEIAGPDSRWRSTQVATERLPRTPLAWRTWQVVVLDHTQAPRLDRDQVRSLLAWLRAGGRLLLVEPPTDTGAIGTLIDSLGPALRSSLPLGVRAHQVGIGRVVVVDPALTERDDSGQMPSLRWSTVTTFLGGQNTQSGERRFRTDLADITVGTLRPGTVTVLPVASVVMVLGVFLLWIGPGEFLLLGLMRKRALTWITFPLAALVATWVLVRLATAVLGGSDQVQRLLVVDAAPDGSVYRSVEFGHHYRAGSGELMTEAAPIAANLPLAQSRTKGFTDLSHRGRIGIDHQITGFLPAWTEALVRRDGVPAAAPIALDWASLDPDDPAVHQAVAAAATEAGLDRWALVSLDPGGRVQALAGEPDTVFGDQGDAGLADLLLGQPPDQRQVEAVGAGATLGDCIPQVPYGHGQVLVFLARDGHRRWAWRVWYPDEWHPGASDE